MEAPRYWSFEVVLHKWTITGCPNRDIVLATRAGKCITASGEVLIILLNIEFLMIAEN